MSNIQQMGHLLPRGPVVDRPDDLSALRRRAATTHAREYQRLLDLDGDDHEHREAEAEGQLAERTIYYMQRAPYIINLQVDRMSSDLLARSETRGLLKDSETISKSVERFSLDPEEAAGILAESGRRA